MYDSYYTTSSNMSTGILFFYLIILAVTTVAQWKVFTKAGKPGWACLVPFYNLYTLFEIVGMNGWMFLLLCVPIVNIIFAFKLYIDLAKAFGKDVGFGLGLIFLSPIFLCILGFGSAEYVGNE